MPSLWNWIASSSTDEASAEKSSLLWLCTKLLNVRPSITAPLPAKISSTLGENSKFYGLENVSGSSGG